jgi:hypothetical protein
MLSHYSKMSFIVLLTRLGPGNYTRNVWVHRGFARRAFFSLRVALGAPLRLLPPSLLAGALAFALGDRCSTIGTQSHLLMHNR